LLHECAAKQKGEAAFPQRLMAQATAMSEGNLPIPFASPNEDGRIVKVNTAKDTFGGHEYYSASAVNFFPRRELPADELYDRCVPWNEVLNFGTYEEMERVMNGGEPDPYNSGAPAATQAPAQACTEEQKQEEFERACEQSLRGQRDKAMTSDALNTWNKMHPAPQQPATHYTQPQPTGFQAAPPTPQPQQAPTGFRSSPAAPGGPLTEEDFARDPYSQPPQRTFPSEQPQPAAAPVQGGCPAGLQFGRDFSTSRKCCNCAQYAQCERASR
jgi:hypothetical protein